MSKTNLIRHRLKEVESVRDAKDMFSILVTHNWELTEVERYGRSGLPGTMGCALCGAECSVLIIPSFDLNSKKDRFSSERADRSNSKIPS